MPALSDDAFLTALFQQFKDDDLPADDSRYEPIYETHPDLKSSNQADLICSRIVRSKVESLSLLSGFRGCGKSTELNRLAATLRGHGFLVLQCDARQYLNLGDKIDIVTLLNAMAGAFSDALQKSKVVNLRQQGYWHRFTKFLRTTDISLEKIGIKAKTPLVAAEATVKLAFTGTPDFRENLRNFLGTRLSELTREVHAFLGDCRAAIARKRGADPCVVFIFDQFEQIPGKPALSSQQQAIIEDTARVFSDYRDLLTFPLIHTVLTVPSWLKFVAKGIEVNLVPNLPLWRKNPDRAPRKESYAVLGSLLERRFDAVTPDACERLFGQHRGKGLHPALKKLIDASGGHFRDLFRLLTQTILRARELPIPPEIADQAINNVRSSYLPIAVEDARWLQRVALLRDSAYDRSNDEDISRLAYFMNNYMVLYFINGEEWYDIHPLIRDEVSEIVRRATVLDKQAATAGPA